MKEDYFQDALSNFTFDVASGGAIRHLADLGYTAKEIMKKLDFPTPYERVQKTVWEHFLDNGVVLLQEPGSPKQWEKNVFVREYDKYGRASFRRVPQAEGAGQTEPVRWKEWHFECHGKYERFASCLEEKCAENGEKTAYISWDFGVQSRKNPAGFLEMLQVLEEKQREYILGLPWENKICCHRLDQRMREVAARLYESGEYHGTAWFMKLSEKVIF